MSLYSLPLTAYILYKHILAFIFNLLNKPVCLYLSSSLWNFTLFPFRKDRCSSVQAHKPGPLHLLPVQHWLYLPLEAGQGERRARALWTVHVIQSEKGSESGAHQQAERRFREGAAAGAGNRTAHLPADVLVSPPQQLIVLVVESGAAGVPAAEAGSGSCVLPPSAPVQPRNKHGPASLHQAGSHTLQGNANVSKERGTQASLSALNSPQSSQGQLSHGVSSVGVRGLPHTFSSSSQLQSAVAAAALVSRPGKHGHVSHHSVQSSKVSSSGFGGSRNIRGGSASSTAWKKQSNSNTGRLTMNNPSPTVATDICSLSNSCLVQKSPLHWQLNIDKTHEEANLFWTRQTLLSCLHASDVSLRFSPSISISLFWPWFKK